MGLVGELLPFFVAAYLLDCLVRVRPGQALFTSLWGRHFRLEGPGWRWVGFLPASESVLVPSLGFRANETGVLLSPSGDGRRRLVAYEDIERVAVEDGHVCLGPGLELKATHPSAAMELAALVEQLRLTARPRRLALIRRALRRRCDLAALRRRRLEQAKDLRMLKVLSGAAFVAFFVVLPASVLPDLAWRPSLLQAGVLFLLAYLAVLSVSVRLLRRVGVRGWALGSRMLPLALFPPAAVHAPALVARETSFGFEPLAAAALLLDPQEFRRLEQRLRREQAAGDGPESGGESVVEAMTLDLVAREAARAGVPELEDPSPGDASAAAFCPECGGQYRTGFARCSDCDVPLEPFAS
ncbi:MAG: hypothetical protein LJF15_12500 [Acidobacteria bacterium]|jgi:hypothetical protein|nr:hypothetical protein [Acidobacteriota bacterium]